MMTFRAQLLCDSLIKSLQSARSMHLLKSKAYVNGEWLSAANGKTVEVKNPSDGSLVGIVPDMDMKDTYVAMEAASEAFKTWQFTTVKERSDLLRKWYNLLVKNQDEIGKLMTLESGKPLGEAVKEVIYGNSYVEWYSEEARRARGNIIPSPVANKKIFVEKEPIGVVGLVTPWNFPHAMIARKSAAALAAGCTCVIKPAEDTPLTALALAELTREAGFPKGVFNVITSSRSNAPSIGKLLCESPLIAGISFTGSTKVGKILYQQCASTIKRISLELGGNAPFIVFNSANIEKAVEGAIAAKFRNAGQTCVAANRFLVQEEIFDCFVSRFAEAIKSIKMGDGQEPGVTLGPIINKTQFESVSRMVQDAQQKGANVLLGGKHASKLGELFYEPTLILDITEDMDLYNLEVFGPVASVIRFKSEDEALKVANNTRNGLAGYFYTEDISQMHRVSKRLEVGMLGVNEGIISTAEAPFGGVKESGLGKEGSQYGMAEYETLKYICIGNL